MNDIRAVRSHHASTYRAPRRVKVVMIGHINFNHRGMQTVATLGDDGQWECQASHTIEAMLNRDFSPIGKPSASGNWGEWELLAGAHALKGVAQLGPPPS